MKTATRILKNCSYIINTSGSLERFAYLFSIHCSPQLKIKMDQSIFMRGVCPGQFQLSLTRYIVTTVYCLFHTRQLKWQGLASEAVWNLSEVLWVKSLAYQPGCYEGRILQFAPSVSNTRGIYSGK